MKRKPAWANQHPLADTTFVEFPLETHAFEVDPKDDYRCLKCHRPRALHADKSEVFTNIPYHGKQM